MKQFDLTQKDLQESLADGPISTLEVAKELCFMRDTMLTQLKVLVEVRDLIKELKDQGDKLSNKGDELLEKADKLADSAEDMKQAAKDLIDSNTKLLGVRDGE